MYKIRNATIADIPLIRELTYQVWPQTYVKILSADQISYMLNMMYSESALQRQMEEGCQFIFIYEDEKPVGFASFQEIGPGKWKLHKIYVLISQQGKGTGKRMIDHIIQEIQSRGASTLELQVNINNKARGFYEKLGFYERELINLDIGNGFFMNDYIMEKKLVPGK